MRIQDTVNKMRMAISAISERIIVGIPNNDNASFKYKVDLSSDFYKCCIQKFGNENMNVGEKFATEINGEQKKYKITLERIE